MEYSDFKNLLSTAIQEIKKEVTFNCNLVTLSENDEKYKTSLDIGCVLESDEVTGSLFFFSKLCNYVLRLAVERGFSKDDQINTILMLNNFHNVNNMDNGYLYFYWNKNISSGNLDVNQETSSIAEESNDLNSQFEEFNFKIEKDKDNFLSQSYIPPLYYYNAVFMKRISYLFDKLKINKNNIPLCRGILLEISQIPLTKESLILIKSLSNLAKEDIILSDELIDTVHFKTVIQDIKYSYTKIHELII